MKRLAGKNNQILIAYWYNPESSSAPKCMKPNEGRKINDKIQFQMRNKKTETVNAINPFIFHWIKNSECDAGMAFAAAGKGGTGDVHNLLNWFKTTNVYRNTGRYTAMLGSSHTGKDKATRTNSTWWQGESSFIYVCLLKFTSLYPIYQRQHHHQHHHPLPSKE